MKLQVFTCLHPRHWDHKRVPSPWLFHVGGGNQAQVLMLSQEHFPNSCLLSPALEILSHLEVVYNPVL